jgi:DNA adenine methylase
MAVNSPIKLFGGKSYLASRIASLLPPHTHYVEPFFGSGAVMFAKSNVGISEVANDLSSNLITLWRVLQDEAMFSKFVRLMQATPFSEELFDGSMTRQAFDGVVLAAKFSAEDRASLSKAANYFLRCRMSHQGMGKGFAALSRNRVRRGMNEQASAWLSAVEGLPAVHARLQKVVITRRDAIRCITSQDGPNTCFYVDAPYVLSTRSTKQAYDHEMTDDQHRELIRTLLAIEGKAVVSMYHHKIYDKLRRKHGWELIELDVPNNASNAKTKNRKVECLWIKS